MMLKEPKLACVCRCLLCGQPEVLQDGAWASNVGHVLLLVPQGLQVARQLVLLVGKHQEHQRGVQTAHVLLRTHNHASCKHTLQNQLLLCVSAARGGWTDLHCTWTSIKILQLFSSHVRRGCLSWKWTLINNELLCINDPSEGWTNHGSLIPSHLFSLFRR